VREEALEIKLKVIKYSDIAQVMSPKKNKNKKKGTLKAVSNPESNT
jgi:hypothetical protein